MIVLGLDLEATGLDKVKDRPIEVGLTLWTTNYNRGLESRNFSIQSDGVTVTDEITEITGLNQKIVDKFGWDPADALEEVIYWMERAEAIVAFNGRRFDIPMMHQWAKRHDTALPDKLVIDPFEDMPKFMDTAKGGMRGQELITMCAKNKIYYDAHEAGADVSGMLRLMATRPFEFVLERAKSPTVIIQSQQSRNNNAAAKRHKFRWNPDRKIWWKAVKQIDLEVLAQEVNNAFGLIERTDLTPESMETDE